MKAAVMYPDVPVPQYTDVETPIAQNSNEIAVRVKAVAIKHFDKRRASGQHYSTEAPSGNGRVVGGDGVCLLDNGTRVYGMGISGMLAESAVIDASRIVPIPDGLDDATAAALPNAVIGAAMGLRFKAGIQPGDVVLINGATGFTGRVAVQIAKHYGAKKVIATGRNPQSLNELLTLGADEIISVTQDDEAFISQIKAIHAKAPIDVIIDYLWGHTAGLLLVCLKGDGSFTNRMRYVTIGSMAGDVLQLSAAILRSADIQLTGSGLGAWPEEQVALLFSEILPEMFLLAAQGSLTIKTATVKLEDIATIWDTEVTNGQRPVVTI